MTLTATGSEGVLIVLYAIAMPGARTARIREDAAFFRTCILITLHVLDASLNYRDEAQPCLRSLHSFIQKMCERDRELESSRRSLPRPWRQGASGWDALRVRRS